jgi:hypothetical protein
VDVVRALLGTLAALVNIYVARWWMALSRSRSLPPRALERAAAPIDSRRHWIHHGASRLLALARSQRRPRHTSFGAFIRMSQRCAS